MKHVDGKVEALRIGVSASVVTIAGLTLNEWVAICTIVYFVIQILILSPKALKIVRDYVRAIKIWLRSKRNV